MKIPIMIEPAFSRSSIWCRQMQAGIEAAAARKKYEIQYLSADDFPEEAFADSSPKARPLVTLVGTYSSWLSGALRSMERKNADVLLAGCLPPEGWSIRGAVHMDYAGGMRRLMEYLKGCGKTCTALYGCFADSFADRVKRQTFLAEVPEKDHALVLENRGGLNACYAQFRECAGKVDSVICVNDLAAASLIGHLRMDGIRVPEDLYVTAFGSTEIARLFSPSITTVTLDYYAMGEQMVSMYAYLRRCELEISMTAGVRCRLEIAGSTAMEPERAKQGNRDNPLPGASMDFYGDEEVRRLMSLEALLMHLDDMDREILRGLLHGVGYELLAEQMEMPVNTLRYRVRRMAQLAGVGGRSELIAFLERAGSRWLDLNAGRDKGNGSA